MKFLKLCFQGPLQSWGERSRWDSRDTAAMPTKSAIIGLLGCCLGLERGSEQLTALDAQVHMAVRADKPELSGLRSQCCYGEIRRFSSGVWPR